MLPFLYTLYQHIQFLIICWIVNHNMCESLRMITYGLPRCIKTSPMAYPLASVWISNGYCKYGSAKTSVVLIFSFNVSKDFFCLPPHWKTCLTLVIACRWAAMYEKLEMDFLQYCTTPKKLWTSVVVVGLGHFTMTSTFAGSIFSWKFHTMYPKYTREVFPNSHLDNLIYNLYFFKSSKTVLTWFIWSSHLRLKINMSYK